jgi:DNA-binding helix-hairpin-helix protein with protein kinase domain
MVQDVMEKRDIDIGGRQFRIAEFAENGLHVGDARVFSLVGDVGKVTFVDFDCVYLAPGRDGLRQGNAEYAGPGAQVGNDLTRLEPKPGNHLVGLEPGNPVRLIERLAPFLSGP